MTLCGEIVDLLRLHLLNDANQVGGVRKVAIVQDHAAVRLVRIAVQMVDPIGVERRGATFDAMHLVALIEQELGEICAILPGDACHERTLPLVNGHTIDSSMSPSAIVAQPARYAESQKTPSAS